MLILFILFQWFLAIVTVEMTISASHQILEFTPQNERDFYVIRNIRTELQFEPDFLTETRSFGKAGAILLRNGDSVDKIVQYFDKNGIENELFEYKQPSRKRILKQFRNENICSLVGSHYLSYRQQLLFVNQLHEKYGDLVKVKNIGKTVEGRNIKSIKFGFPGKNKPILWVNAGIHAREWIGHSTAFYFMNQLTTNPEWLQILRKINIIISPNANPDGYEYSRTNDRLWRTNRKIIKSGNSTCHGIDINRNFPFTWKPYKYNVTTICEDPYRLVYPGIRPASEKETKSLTRAMEKVKNRIKGFIDIHNAGELIMYPWGYARDTFPADVEELKEVANRMKDAIQKERGNNYTVVNKPIDGGSIYYAAGSGVKYAYLLELPGANVRQSRWVTPESWIEPVAKEIINALKVLANQIVNEFAL